MDSEKKTGSAQNNENNGTKLDGVKAADQESDSHALQPDTKQKEPGQPGVSAEGAKVSGKEEAKKVAAGSHLQVSHKDSPKYGDDREQDFDEEESNKNWSEYRVSGKAPTRRGYHASFIHDNYLYVHGGHDIREGTLDTMHRIHLEPSSNDNEWEQISQRGMQKPGCISYHTLTRHGDQAFLFGGSDLGIDNSKMFSFDIENCEWKVISDLSNETGDQPITRDEHSAVLWNDTIVIFGGNVKGFKSNDVWFYHVNENKWEEVKADNSPPERSNHAYTISGDKMYIFGGKDIENNKLKDLWCFDCNSKSWTEVDAKGDDLPICRSGASLVSYKNYLLLFGGIFELTKELGDLYAFDTNGSKWFTIFEETDSPVHKHSPGSTFGMGRFNRADSIKSPSPVNSSFKKSDPNFSMSLKKTKKSKKNLNHSIFEVDSSMLKKQKQMKALIKKREKEKNPMEHSMLTSPTSLSMKNSFLINNTGKGFENYFNHQKKKKLGLTLSPDVSQISPSKVARNSKVTGLRPRPRDGHTAMFWNDNMVIFGGDRHHMPFNDLFSLDLAKEMN
ncbi:unnamed protein product [Moneuplotes crassus]|uniref:Uncharacterized protein n=2 Tax=Euplotes crassus TaxID=5936 RepID=A0AAD1U8B0_EUPCR|nr:unnamed protein product [Moneuplotes crassus]